MPQFGDPMPRLDNGLGRVDWRGICPFRTKLTTTTLDHTTRDPDRSQFLWRATVKALVKSLWGCVVTSSEWTSRELRPLRRGVYPAIIKEETTNLWTTVWKTTPKDGEGPPGESVIFCFRVPSKERVVPSIDHVYTRYLLWESRKMRLYETRVGWSEDTLGGEGRAGRIVRRGRWMEIQSVRPPSSSMSQRWYRGLMGTYSLFGESGGVTTPPVGQFRISWSGMWDEPSEPWSKVLCL